jgi:hypothetical protein
MIAYSKNIFLLEFDSMHYISSRISSGGISCIQDNWFFPSSFRICQNTNSKNVFLDTEVTIKSDTSHAGINFYA